MPTLDPLSRKCPTCDAEPGSPCTRIGYRTRVEVAPHIDRTATARVIPRIQLPLHPPRPVLLYLAGDPLILTPADEIRARGVYSEIIRRANQ